VQKRRAEDPTETADTVQRSRKVLRQSREHSAATTSPPDDAQLTSNTTANTTAPTAANFVRIPTPAVGSAEASAKTRQRRSGTVEMVLDRISIAPDHRKDRDAANADRVAQLTSMAVRQPTLFNAATGAAKIESERLPPAKQLALINIMKYVVCL
jgi:hypothetical protein